MLVTFLLKQIGIAKFMKVPTPCVGLLLRCSWLEQVQRHLPLCATKGTQQSL